MSTRMARGLFCLLDEKRYDECRENTRNSIDDLPPLLVSVSIRRHRCRPIGALTDNYSPSSLIGLVQLTASSYRRDSLFFPFLGKSHARQNGAPEAFDFCVVLSYPSRRIARVLVLKRLFT